MKFLLDTHTLLWFDAGDPRLSQKAMRSLQEKDAELLLSAASVWEMAIKSRHGRLKLPSSVEAYVAEMAADGLQILPIEWRHAAAVETLPDYHRDPFDRLLAAQAITERLSLITGDPIFHSYGVNVIW